MAWSISVKLTVSRSKDRTRSQQTVDVKKESMSTLVEVNLLVLNLHSAVDSWMPESTMSRCVISCLIPNVHCLLTHSLCFVYLKKFQWHICLKCIFAVNVVCSFLQLITPTLPHIRLPSSGVERDGLFWKHESDAVETLLLDFMLDVLLLPYKWVVGCNCQWLILMFLFCVYVALEAWLALQPPVNRRLMLCFINVKKTVVYTYCLWWRIENRRN